MAGITSYPTSMGRGFAGQIADDAPRYVRTGINKESTQLPFGLVVKKGTNDDEVVLPTTSSDKLMGILVHRHDVNTIGASAWASTAGIPVGDRTDLMVSGVVYAIPEENVVQGDPVYYRFGTSGALTQKGALRKSSDTNATTAIKGAYWLESGSAGAPVPLYVNFAAQY